MHDNYIFQTYGDVVYYDYILNGEKMCIRDRDSSVNCAKILSAIKERF